MRVWMALSLVGVLACTQSPEASSPAPEAEPIVETEVPMLVFPTRYMDDATVMTHTRWYAIHHEADGLILHLHGTTAFVEPPDDLVPEEVQHNVQIRGGEGFDTVDSGIRVLSWLENGTAYTLDVTCAEAGDERCTESAFALALAAELETGR